MECTRSSAVTQPVLTENTNGQRIHARIGSEEDAAQSARRFTAANGKLSRDEIAFREELVKGFRAIRGMQIEDLYPPSDHDDKDEVRP